MRNIDLYKGVRMRNFDGKFEKICENTLYRFQQGGFLRGDYVRIKKDALKHSELKQISAPMRSILENVIKSGIPLRISYIKSGSSEAFNGPVDAANSPCCELWADVVTEYAPGMWKDPMTLPLGVLEKVDVGGEYGMEGYAQYSKDIVRPNRTDNEEGSSVEQTKGKDDERKLTRKNKKLEHTPKPKDGRDSTTLKDSYNMLRENDMIFEGYRKSMIKQEEIIQEGILSKAGGAIGKGMMGVGNKIANAGSKVYSKSAGFGNKSPEEIAAEFSEIKASQGEEALKKHLEALQRRKRRTSDTFNR